MKGRLAPTCKTESLQKEPLPTSFACLFCNHESSVSVKMDKKGGTGELSCKICGQQFQTGINCTFLKYLRVWLVAYDYRTDLSAAVDVYSDWIDACDTVAKDATAPGDGGRAYSDGNIRATSRQSLEADDSIIDDGDEDGEEDFRV